MKRFSGRMLSLLMCALMISSVASANEQNKTQIYKEVEQAERNGVVFTPISLFTAAKGSIPDVLSEATLLNADAKSISAVFKSQPQAIALQLTTAAGRTYQLNGMRSYPLAPGAKRGYIDANGRHDIAIEPGLHYQGAVMGSEQSLFAISIFGNGDVMILFANEEGNYVVGKMEGSEQYVLYNDGKLLSKPEMPCATADEKDIVVEQPSGAKTTASYQCNKVRLYWEADYGLYNYYVKNVNTVQNYMAGVFNQVQTMYRNERIAVELTSVDVWTTDDGYSDGNSHDALTDFQSAWTNKGGKFEGDLGMLLARDPGGNGGVAFRGGLCNGSYKYAYGDVNGTYEKVPVYSWDVQMITHELGHNLASPHTHWCGWNTGAGGSCGAIDNCYNLESGSGCNSCTYTFSNSAPVSSWQGTVMSYCHLKSRGINLANGFGPLPGDMIRNAVSTLPCLKSIISATLTPTTLCKDYATITLTYDKSSAIGNQNFGTPNYTYKWSAGNVTTKDIVVVKTGNYSVIVTDSNNCKETFNISVLQDGAPECKSTSVNDIEKQYISLHPNPASNEAVLKFFSNKAEQTIIKLTDITGKTILVKNISVNSGENNYHLNLDGVNNGMYYISLISNATEYINLKLVVNK